MSESHSGIFIPLSDLDHPPQHDTVVINRASTSETFNDYPDSRTVDTRSTLTDSLNSLNSLGGTGNVVSSNRIINDNSTSGRGSLRTQAAFMEAILYGNPNSGLPTANPPASADAHNSNEIDHDEQRSHDDTFDNMRNDNGVDAEYYSEQQSNDDTFDNYLNQVSESENNSEFGGDHDSVASSDCDSTHD